LRGGIPYELEAQVGMTDVESDRIVFGDNSSATTGPPTSPPL